MIKKAFAIKNGLYLLVDPSMDMQLMLQKVEAALKGGVSIIQILNNFQANTRKVLVIESVKILAHRFDVPVLINEDISDISHVDGIHFDNIPENFEALKATLFEGAIIGITCDNDLSKLEWALRHNLNYVSFGSIFPTDSIPSYKIINLESVRKARAYSDIPIFLSGGITPDNMNQLDNTGLDGVAVVSGIMNAEDPLECARDYIRAITRVKRKQKTEFAN